MPINTSNSLLTKEQFDLQLSKLLGQLEGRSPTPYIDTAKAKVPTIGIGINLRVDANRNSLFDAMKISDTALQDALKAVITDTSITTTSALQTALDAAYGAPFVLTDAQIVTTYTKLVADYVKGAKEKNDLPYSTELLALVSAQFNGVYGPKTIAALNISDPYEARAEAWYQIRYEHVEGQNEKRRYAEAALFGLYEPGTAMSEEAARGVYRMYTAHSNKMIDHDVAYAGLLSEANLDLQEAGFSSTAADLETSLQSAANLLVAQYGQGQSFSPLNIWVGKSTGSTLFGASTNPSLLIGDASSDALAGGGGNDVLVGGSGADTLKGGAGIDTYVFKAGEGKDTIIDSDGLGSIVIGGTTLTGAAQADYKMIGNQGQWSVNNGQTIYTLDEANKRLVISGTALGADNTITINEVDVAKLQSDDKFLGIKLDRTLQTALVQGAGSNVFGASGFDPDSLAGQQSNIAEGTGKTFTLYLNQAAKAGETVTLALSSLADKFKAILGDSIVDANGAVITLAEGETQVSFALVQQGDVSADASMQLSASYTGADGSATSNAWGVNLSDAGAITSTFNGDSAEFFFAEIQELLGTGLSGFAPLEAKQTNFFAENGVEVTINYPRTTIPYGRGRFPEADSIGKRTFW